MTSNDSYSRRERGDYDAYRPSQEDRHRDARDRDRDRDLGFDRSRDRNLNATPFPRDTPRSHSRPAIPPVAPRAELSRKEHRGPDQPITSHSKTPTGVNASLEAVIRKFSEVAQKKTQLEQRVVEKRIETKKKSEYSKCHSDFSSATEAEKRYRDRIKKDLFELEKQLKTQEAAYDKALKDLGACVVESLPLEIDALVQRRMEAFVGKYQGSFIERSIDAKLYKKLQAREKADEENEVKRAAAVEEKLAARFEERFRAQQGTIDRLLADHKATKAELETLRQTTTSTPTSTVNEAELADVRTRIEKLENHRDARDKPNTSTEVSQIRLANKKLRDDFDNFKTSAALRSELTPFKVDIGGIQHEIAKIPPRVDQLNVDIGALERRVTDSAKTVEGHGFTLAKLDTASLQHRAELSKLDTSTSEHGNQIARLDGLTQAHQNDLKRLDVTQLEAVVEDYSIEWANVLSATRAFGGVTDRVEKLEQIYPDVVRYKERLAHVEGTTQSLRDRVGRLTPARSVAGEGPSRQASVGSRTDRDDYRDPDLGSRIQKLDDRVRLAEGKVAEVDKFTNDGLIRFAGGIDSLTNRVKNVEKRTAQFDALNGRLDTMADQIGQMKGRLDEVPQQTPLATSHLQSDPEVKEFKTKVERFEGDFTKLSTEVQTLSKASEHLEFQITSLDSQYNNLTTKQLAEHILNRMSLVYPHNDTIIANQAEFVRRMNAVEQETRRALYTCEELRKRVNSLVGQEAATQPPSKRRRFDEGAASSPGPSSNASPTSRAAGPVTEPRPGL